MEKAVIFLVDDNPANLRAGKSALMENYAVYTAAGAARMFDLLAGKKPSLILLDIDMPGMNGYEAIKRLKSNPGTADIPVIFLTGKSDSGSELDGLSSGAVDYITKPFVPPLLLKRIEVHLLIENQKKALLLQTEILENQQRQLDYYSKKLKKAFDTYLSEEVVQKVISDPSLLHLGGSRQNMTVMFTDIQKSTTIAEKLEPENLVTLFNRYLTGMSDILIEQGGIIDKYVGDAIVSFFGAPGVQPDHASRACASAILMKRREREMNVMFLREGISPLPLRSRIGINSGDMIVGNMGSERRLSYTVMGNEVNIASRLETINKQFGSWILVSENTRNAAGEDFLYRRLGQVELAGITKPVKVYELLNFAKDAGSNELRQVDMFHRALELFEQRDWTKAKTEFLNICAQNSNDMVSKVYAGRCALFHHNPSLVSKTGKPF
jgi:class 3 adenylate cyclase/ActR/RegA family two-component response regulator